MEEANLEDEGVMIMPPTHGPRGNPEVKVTIGAPIPEMADQQDTITIRFFCFGSYFQITCSSDQIPNFKFRVYDFLFFLQKKIFFCIFYNVEV